MDDSKLNKVIKAIEQCLKESEHIDDNPCKPCPYCDKSIFCNHEQFLRDVLELLKEQEVVEPKKTAYQRVDHIIAYRYRCGTCDMSIFPSYKYCPFCGQAVKWE